MVLMMKASSWLMLLLGSSSLSAVSSQMVEYDLVELPDFQPDNGNMPSKYKVQCPAGGRCYLQTNNTTEFGPSGTILDGAWNFAQGDERMRWYYFSEGAENITLEDMFLSSSSAYPFIGGSYCGDDATCSIICTDDCVCGLEWWPTPECKVKQEYLDLVLPAPTERIIYEYLQDLNDFENGQTMQLRCPDFLNGCYLDADSFKGGGTTSPSDYDGFFAIDYLTCFGDDDATIPCRLGCDPDCSCTLLNRSDNTTEDCAVAPPTVSPTPMPAVSPPTMPTVSSGMVEYDLVELPDFEPDNDLMPTMFKVQCPAGGRCYLQTNASPTFFGPSGTLRDGAWNFAQGDERMSWFYFLEGAENITLENLFFGSSSSFDPFIIGTYCDNDSTCSIICSHDCLCGSEWWPTPECKVKQKYPDLVLPAPTEHTIYEYLQDSSEFENGQTMQLRCPDFLNGCYLDSDSFTGSSTSTPSDYDGFFAIDYLACTGDKDATIPCKLGCDPGCSCTILNRSDNTTEDCTLALPPTPMPTVAPGTPTMAPNNSGAFGVGTWASAVVAMISCLWW